MLNFSEWYYTFVHGQQWNYFFPERLFTDLWGAHQGKKVEEFLFPHVRTRDDENQEDRDHKRLLENGRKDWDDHDGRKKLLFLNAPFFGNTNNGGSSTAHYFANNYNINSIDLPLEKVFELHGDIDIYNKHKQELDALKQEYASLSNGHGNILFFAIPKKLAEEYVYSARPGGYKKTITIDGKQTDDIKLIMDTYQHHPEKMADIDENEFCIIMLKEAMNPDSGIKVKVFNVADPKKWKAFSKKYEKLMYTIWTDIDAKQANKPSTSHDPHLFEKFLELVA